jgi:hypothetical protein
MINNGSSGVRVAQWLRRIARLIGSLAAVFWVFSLTASFIGEVISDSFTWRPEGVVLGGLVIVSVFGVLIAWRWERTGGVILVLCGLALSVFAYISAGHNKAFAILVSGVPFLVSGVLFLLSWWMSRHESQTELSRISTLK